MGTARSIAKKGREISKEKGGIDLSSPEAALKSALDPEGQIDALKGVVLGDPSKKDDRTPKQDIAAESIAAQKEGIAAGRAEVQGRAAPTVAGVSQVDRAGIQDVAPTQAGAAQIATAPQAQFRGQQSALAQQLAAQAAGEGPSVAQLQLKQATDRSLAQQLALQAGASGPQAAAARRQAVTQQALSGQEAAGTSAILRLQEQQQAQQQLAGVTQAGREADIGLATSQASLEQQTAITNADRSLKADLANQGIDLDVLKANAAAGNTADLANLAAQLKQTGMNDDMIRAYMAQELGLSAQDVQLAGVEAGIGTAGQAAQAQQGAAGVGALGGIIAAFSDKKLKKNIKYSDEDMKYNSEYDGESYDFDYNDDGVLDEHEEHHKMLAEWYQKEEGGGPSEDMDYGKDHKKESRLGEFLSKLDVYNYDYKDEKHGKGKQTSVMAQDLEKSEIGKKAIMETPEGKMVDYGSLLPAMLSANVDAHKRIKTLEEALKAKKKGK